ncbi:hypothetical protein NW752_009967 [Fusarium irregulare]|nr:hypothetical protein NW752_009967 [Fusarium irregulare]
MPPVVSGRVRKSDPKQSASNSKARTKEDRIARRRAKAADDQLQWENQYLQGKPAAYFAGYDREVIPNTSPFVQVTSPFKGLGKIEFTAETDEPGWDFFRLSSGEKSSPNHHVFVVPHQHIERIIIIPTIPDGNLKWIFLIVPTAATGSSLAVGKYPKIIQFEIPETDLDGAKILRESVRSGASHEFRTVAVGLMIQAKEPFYEGEGQPKKPFLYFKDIQGFGTRRKHIECFCAAHQINLQLVEQLFYSYDDNTPMGGWMPLNGDGYDTEDHGLESDPDPDPDPDPYVDSESDSEDDDDCVFLGAA